MPTIRKLRVDLGWTINRLATEAHVARDTAKNAELGKPVIAETAKAIAEALSRGYGRKILPSDLEGVDIK